MNNIKIILETTSISNGVGASNTTLSAGVTNAATTNMASSSSTDPVSSSTTDFDSSTTTILENDGSGSGSGDSSIVAPAAVANVRQPSNVVS